MRAGAQNGTGCHSRVATRYIGISNDRKHPSATILCVMTALPKRVASIEGTPYARRLGIFASQKMTWRPKNRHRPVTIRHPSGGPPSACWSGMRRMQWSAGALAVADRWDAPSLAVMRCDVASRVSGTCRQPGRTMHCPGAVLGSSASGSSGRQVQASNDSPNDDLRQKLCRREAGMLHPCPDIQV